MVWQRVVGTMLPMMNALIVGRMVQRVIVGPLSVRDRCRYGELRPMLAMVRYFDGCIVMMH